MKRPLDGDDLSFLLGRVLHLVEEVFHLVYYRWMAFILLFIVTENESVKRIPIDDDFRVVCKRLYLVKRFLQLLVLLPFGSLHHRLKVINRIKLLLATLVVHLHVLRKTTQEFHLIFLFHQKFRYFVLGGL